MAFFLKRRNSFEIVFWKRISTDCILKPVCFYWREKSGCKSGFWNLSCHIKCSELLEYVVPMSFTSLHPKWQIAIIITNSMICWLRAVHYFPGDMHALWDFYIRGDWGTEAFSYLSEVSWVWSMKFEPNSSGNLSVLLKGISVFLTKSIYTVWE